MDQVLVKSMQHVPSLKINYLALVKFIMTSSIFYFLFFIISCTALVVGSDDVASSYSIGVLTRRQVGRREGSRGAREVASY